MRILMLTDSFFPEVGGSETAIWNLSDTMTDLGHAVGVAVIAKPDARSPSERLAFWNVPSRMYGMDAKFIGRIHHLRAIIRAFKPDVVNAHFMLESGYVGVKAAHAEGVPCVLTNRGKGLYNKPTNVFERLLYPFWNKGACGADACIATSQEMVDIARERYGLASVAISNGVDIDNFTPSKDGTYLREQHGVGANQKVILCVRRLVPKNGIEYIVRALPAIRERHDAVLWLAAPKIREYEKLKRIVAESGMEEYVRFLGAVDHHDLPFYLAAADVVVQPSIAEARSLACLEAMASGCAIVSTDAGGLKELITHGENGYLIREFQEGTYAVTEVFPDGVKRLAEAVSIVLGDDALRVKIGDGARRYAEAYSWMHVTRQTLEVYERAIAAYSRAT